MNEEAQGSASASGSYESKSVSPDMIRGMGQEVSRHRQIEIQRLSEENAKLREALANANKTIESLQKENTRINAEINVSWNVQQTYRWVIQQMTGR